MTARPGHEQPRGEVILERLDPLSAAAARPVTRGAAFLAAGLALATVLARPTEIVYPGWLVVALVALGVVVALLIIRSRPDRPPWRGSSTQLVHLLLIIMMVSSVASTLEANARLRDDWGPMVIGIVLIALMPYRSAREIAFWATVHTLVCAMLGIVQSPWAVTDVPALTFAVTGSLPVAALGYAAAAYARSLNGSIALWHERAWAAAAEAARQQRGGVARSVQQHRVTILNRDVVPFLSRMSEQSTVSDADREEARALARTIRALLVATVERGWAETMLDEYVGQNPHLNIGVAVDDADDAAGRATLEQRTLLRAIADVSIHRLAATAIDVTVDDSDGRLRVRWLVRTPLEISDARRAFRAIFEVVRALTEHSALIEKPGQFVLEFHYGQ